MFVTAMENEWPPVPAAAVAAANVLVIERSTSSSMVTSLLGVSGVRISSLATIAVLVIVAGSTLSGTS